MDGEDNSKSQNYTFYNGTIDLPRVNKFSSPGTSPNHHKQEHSPRSADDADASNTSDDHNSPKSNVDDTHGLFVPRPPSLPKTKTRVVRAQIHNQLKGSNKVAPYLSPLVDSSRLPPIERNIISKNRLNVNNGKSAEKSVNKTDISSENVNSQKSIKQDVERDAGLVNDHNLINKYKQFINKRYTEEIVDGDSSSSENELSISVSSLSGDEDDGLKTLTATGFEPLYSLPIKEKKQTTENLLNKIVISKSNSTNPYLKTSGSLPDLRSVDEFNLKRVSHVAKNESEAESEPGAQIGYKFKPLPPIPGTTSNISCNSGFYETIDGLSKLKSSKHSIDNEKERPKRKTFKDIATILTLVPRLTTNSVRSRKNDHHLADITQYLPDKKLKVFVGTWNMKGTKVYICI